MLHVFGILNRCAVYTPAKRSEFVIESPCSLDAWLGGKTGFDTAAGKRTVWTALIDSAKILFVLPSPHLFELALIIQESIAETVMHLFALWAKLDPYIALISGMVPPKAKTLGGGYYNRGKTDADNSSCGG